MSEGGFLNKPWVIVLVMIGLVLGVWRIWGVLGSGGVEDEVNIITKNEGIAVSSLEQLGVIPEKMKLYGTTFWVVDLSGKTLTDEALESLKYLKPVGQLNLSQSTITDDQLSFISDIGVVVKLNLSETNISDAGLKALEPIEFVADLDLRKTNVTKAGAKQFQSTRPSGASLPVPEEEKANISEEFKSLSVKF